MHREEPHQQLINRFNIGIEENSTVVVPIIEHDLFLNLASEAVREILEKSIELDLLLFDGLTLDHIYRSIGYIPKARHAGCFGAINNDINTIASEQTGSIHIIPRGDHFRTSDRLLLMISKDTAVVVLGSFNEAQEEDGYTYHGGWSVQFEYVIQVATELLGPLHAAWIPQHEKSLRNEIMAGLALRMMRHQADTLASRQRHIVKEKDDIFSVLNILKAISAKRRAHDILYVFVEQIARVISANRCSIVRVWGNDTHGYVLASHEDIHINGHQIELDNYPELIHAMNVRSKVVIDNVKHHPLTKVHAKKLTGACINALLVIPIVLFDENVGSLLLRAARSEGSFGRREVSFFEIVSEAAANALERAQLFENIQLANQRLEHLAITDGLTDLYNHRYFLDKLESEFQRAKRYHLPLSCLLFDVDNFKQFNDTYGHLMGDNVLRELAHRALNIVRQSDIVARYGGEEFVIILPQTGMEGALVEAERLRKIVAEHPFKFDGETYEVTISVGVSSFDKETTHNSETLIRLADEALYKAKAAGKNRVCGPGDLSSS